MGLVMYVLFFLTAGRVLFFLLCGPGSGLSNRRSALLSDRTWYTWA